MARDRYTTRLAQGKIPQGEIPQQGHAAGTTQPGVHQKKAVSSTMPKKAVAFSQAFFVPTDTPLGFHTNINPLQPESESQAVMDEAPVSHMPSNEAVELEEGDHRALNEFTRRRIADELLQQSIHDATIKMTAHDSEVGKGRGDKENCVCVEEGS